MSLFDNFFVVIGFIIIAVSVFMIANIFNRLINNIPTNENSQVIITKYTEAENSLDVMNALIFVGLIIGIIIMSAIIPYHPAFLVIAIILSIILLVFVPSLANVYINVANHEEFASMQSKFPLTNLIVQNYPTIILFVILISSIVAFKNIV